MAEFYAISQTFLFFLNEANMLYRLLPAETVHISVTLSRRETVAR